MFRAAPVCAHLAPIKKFLLELAARIKKVGPTMGGKKAWLWFDRLLNKKVIRKAVPLEPCVRDHYWFDPHYWREEGFVCKRHGDGIMGPA